MSRCFVFGGDKGLNMEFDIIRKLAKAELHCHLDGSVSMGILKQICREQKINLPPDDELQEMITVSKSCKTLNEYLSKFKLFGIALKEKEALKAAAIDLISQAADENVIYIEARFAPILSATEKFSEEEAIDAVLEGLEFGKNKFGVEYGLLLCCLRGRNEEENLKVINLAEKYKNKKVCGVDLAGNESKYPNEMYEKIFKLAKEKDLNITIHSGECGNAENIISAIKMGAKRVGHGLALANNKKMLDNFSSFNVALEMCPISNIQTGAVENWRHYPIKDFIEKGISVCVNTDNRTVSGTSLSQEFLMLSKQVGFSYSDMLKTTIDSIRFAFINEETKIKLIEKVYKSYEKEIGEVPCF